MSKPRMMNVYGRLRAILTIHMKLYTSRRTTVVAFNQKKLGRARRPRPNRQCERRKEVDHDSVALNVTRSISIRESDTSITPALSSRPSLTHRRPAKTTGD